ncbi:LPS translocon maturation chaperone LptM [Ectothiorhodospira mobilis]|nr:lipoprotein [Ectothiorhodospira mobilis]MBK1691790.1 hypothetical protein [Ectothiorhodospira mobilis]
MRPWVSRRLCIALVMLLGCASLLAGCGQRGDLYLPGETPPGEADR